MQLTEEDLAAFDSEEEGDVSAVEAEDAMQPSGPAAVPPGSVCMDLSGLSHVTWLMLPFHARMKPLICQLSQLGMLEQLYLQVRIMPASTAMQDISF